MHCFVAGFLYCIVVSNKNNADSARSLSTYLTFIAHFDMLNDFSRPNRLHYFTLQTGARLDFLSWG